MTAVPALTGPVAVRDRWRVIIAYGMVAGANQLLWLTFTPVATPSAHFYGVSVSDIGWLSQIFPLLYVVLAVPAASLLDRWFRPMLLAGAALGAVGGVVRLDGPSFGAALTGQILIAIAQPIVLTAVTGVANGYLSAASRPIGIALGSAWIFLGILVSLGLGSALGGSHVHALLVIGAIIGVVSAVMLAAAFASRDQPPIAGDVTGVTGLRTVWADRAIRRLTIFAMLGFGLFVALTTWLQPLLKPAGISASTAGWLLVAMVFAGVVGSAVLPPLVVRRRRAPLLFHAAAGTSGAALVLFALWKSVPAIAVAIAIMGFFMLASLPVILELAERRAGSASISATALVWLMGNAGGIVIALVVQAIEHHPLVAFLALAVGAAFAFALAPREQSEFSG